MRFNVEALLSQGLTYEEVADIIGETPRFVQRYANRRGLPYEPSMTVEQMEAAERVLLAGGSEEEAAKASGRHVSAIRACVRARGSVLTSWHKIRIHDLYDSGVTSIADIARETGLPYESVSSYVYKHLKRDPMYSMEEVVERIRELSPFTYAALVGG